MSSLPDLAAHPEQATAVGTAPGAALRFLVALSFPRAAFVWCAAGPFLAELSLPGGGGPAGGWMASLLFSQGRLPGGFAFALCPARAAPNQNRPPLNSSPLL